jgi:hypothetical protein
MVGGYAVHFIVAENFTARQDSGRKSSLTLAAAVVIAGIPLLLAPPTWSTLRLLTVNLTTGICSGTKPEVMVGGLLRELRAIRDGARVDDLFGTIGIGPNGPGYDDLAETHPLT